MHRMWWLGLVGALACVGGAAAQTVTFESPTYTAATALVGQDTWAQNSQDPSGSFTVITGDNGPSIAGTQCVEVVGPTAGAWRVYKAITNLVPVGTTDKVITFEYDFKYVNYPNANGIDFRVRVVDSPTGLAGIAGAHSDVTGGTGFTWYGSWMPTGNPAGFAGAWGGAPNLIPNPAQWNHIKYVYYYGTGTGATYGQLMYIEYNGSKIYAFDCWGISPANDIDTIQIRALARATSYITRFDNIQITVADPTGMPNANAGPDQAGLPSTYDGAYADLDGTASSQPGGSLVYYRWTVDGNPPAVKVQGASASAPQDVPVAAGATTNVRLAVVGSNGLQDSDTVAITTLPASPIPIDNLAGPFATKNGDIHGTAQNPLVLPNGDLQFQLITQVQGGAFGFSGDDVPDRAMVFDDIGNIYRVQWYRKLNSVDPNFNLRWESVEIGGYGINSTAVLVGDRYVYTVGTGERNNDGTANPAALPSVWAFNKVSGQVVWRQELKDVGSGVQEPIPTAGNWRTIAALYNNKIYVVGQPFDQTGDSVNDSVRIFRVDVGTDSPGPVTPTLDWGRVVSWGSMEARFGNMVVIPTGGPSNEVILCFAGRSNAGDDGLADAVGITVNNGGVVSSWGVDGILADLSAVTYSSTTGQLYVRSQSDAWANVPEWRINPVTGTPAATQVQADATAQTRYDQEAVALSFAGNKVHSGASDGWVYTYTDDGAKLVKGGAKWAAYGFTGNNAALVRNAAGDEIMVTSFGDGRWWIPWQNPPAVDGSTRQFARIVALNLTQAAPGVPGEAEIDDGPIYFDSVKVLRNGVTVFEDDFQSYPVGPLTLPNAKWTSTSDAGAPVPQIVLEGSNKVLVLNPFGGNSFQYVGIKANVSLPAPSDGDVIQVQWQQKRVDLTDNGGITTSASVPGGAGGLGVFEWDGAGDPGSQKAYATGADPDWSPTANLAVNTWQAGELAYEYALGIGIGQQNMTLAGTNNGEGASAFDPTRVIDRVELWYQATPPTSSGWTPTVNDVAAEYATNADHFANNWSEPDGLSISPNGDIYCMDFGDNYQRRWYRLRLVGTGPVLCAGDMDCSGTVDFDDIDLFVEALGYPGGTGWPHACPWLNGDCDGNQQVNFDDIDPFVARIGASCN